MAICQCRCLLPSPRAPLHFYGDSESEQKHSLLGVGPCLAARSVCSWPEPLACPLESYRGLSLAGTLVRQPPSPPRCGRAGRPWMGLPAQCSSRSSERRPLMLSRPIIPKEYPLSLQPEGDFFVSEMAPCHRAIMLMLKYKNTSSAHADRCTTYRRAKPTTSRHALREFDALSFV